MTRMKGREEGEDVGWSRGGGKGTEKTMATYDPFLARSFIHLLTLLSRFYSLSSLCAFNLPGGRQMFAPLPLDRTTHLSLLFFLLLHLRVSSRHFLFPSPVRSPCERFAPFSAAPLPRIPRSLLHRPEYID